MQQTYTLTIFISAAAAVAFPDRPGLQASKGHRVRLARALASRLRALRLVRQGQLSSSRMLALVPRPHSSCLSHEATQALASKDRLAILAHKGQLEYCPLAL